jgi:hypothetical protein
METWDNVKAMECKAWANVKAIYQNLGFGFRCLTPLSTIFQLYRAVSFIGGGTQRKPTTYRKSPTNFIT